MHTKPLQLSEQSWFFCLSKVYCIDSDINSPSKFCLICNFFSTYPRISGVQLLLGGFLRAPINRGFSTNLHTDKNTVITFYNRVIKARGGVRETRFSLENCELYDFF